MRKLWYEQEARLFEEALPIGNGHIGGMIYGGAEREQISLNDDTLWSGYPLDKSVKTASEGMKEAKVLYERGDLEGTETTLWQKCLSGWTEAYQPAGSLIIETAGISDMTHYCRELNLGTAVTETTFQSEGMEFTREAFCSYPADVLCVQQKGGYNFKKIISLECPHPHRFSQHNGVFVMEAIAPVYCAPNYHNVPDPVKYDCFEKNRALTYAVAVKPVLYDGQYGIEDGKLIIDASDFTLFVSIFTNFEGYDIQPCSSTKNTVAMSLSAVEHAAEEGYESVKASHIADYRALFERVELMLDGKERRDLPTDRRIISYKDTCQEDDGDVDLVALVFDYGRYLTIAASRLGTQPSTLQGIWNEKVRAPWSSNYTLNINTEMNYWLAEKCNLSECHLPLLVMVEQLAEKGRETARNYGFQGWCAHHNTDLWRQTEPVGGESESAEGVGYGYWPLGGVWLTRHIFEHYEYTGNIVFLKKNSGIIKGAAQFLLDRIEKKGDVLHTPVSTSPENHYHKNGNDWTVSTDCAMDISMTQDIFTIFIKMAKILDQDLKFAQELAMALKQLAPLQSGTKGQILEWGEEEEESEPLHRHLSHLYGVYPAFTISEATPELRKAAETSMRLRGDEATGWGIAWKMVIWARLANGEKAKLCIDKAMRPTCMGKIDFFGGGGLYPNLFGAHPPFQIDSNYGITAGIAELLLQCEGETVILLPALPNAFGSGMVSGLCAKGGLTVTITWKEHLLHTVVLSTTMGSKVNYTIQWNNKEAQIYLDIGHSITLSAADFI